jgi:Putative Actinobacterial Holin-X, holin superfamily III
MTSQNGATERTLGQLVADATTDISSLIRSEIALAKLEIGADVKRAAAGGGMFVVAAVFAFLALILLLIAAAFGLVAAGLEPWLAFLIVAVVLLLIGAVLVLIGRRTVNKIKGRPERTIKNAQDTVSAIKGRADTPPLSVTDQTLSR